MGYGQMVREAREDLGLNQEDIAEALWRNKDHGAVSRIESERRRVYPAEFEPLCQLLHLRRVQFVEAMGYRLGLLPKVVRMPDELGELYDIIAQMTLDERLFVLRVARGELAGRRGEEMAG